MEGYVIQRKTDKKFFTMKGSARRGYNRSKWFAKQMAEIWTVEADAKEYLREIIAADARHYGNKTAKTTDYNVLCCEINIQAEGK